MLGRRQFVGGTIACVALPVLAQDVSNNSNPLQGANYVDLFAPGFVKGIGDPLPEDINTANGIVSSNYLPHDDPYSIMEKLSELGTKHKADFPSKNGRPFNQRWPDRANPLIVRFFHDLNYHKLQYPGDCTPWCAATTGWCLNRAGYKIPPDPASSQSYFNDLTKYGQAITTPARGDLCVFTDVDDSNHGHVGFFVSRTGDTLKVLGGNQIGHGATNCGRDYPQSEIGYIDLPINAGRKRAVGVHYLAAYVRPIRA